MSIRYALQWMLVVAWSAVAPITGALTTDGNWDDWFSFMGGSGLPPSGSGNDATAGGNNWNANAGNLVFTYDLGIRYFAVPDGTYPGEGGQDHDIEAILFAYDFETRRLHFGMVSGFDSQGVLGVDGPNYVGDVFFGLGTDVPDTFAVTVGMEGSRAGQLFGNLGGWTTLPVSNPAYSAISDPYRVDENAGGVVDLTAARNLEVRWGHNVNGSTNHNFLEISFLIDPFEEELATEFKGQLSIHWTMLGGNDAVNFDMPLPLMPEPSTMVLLSLGLAGLALRRRVFR